MSSEYKNKEVTKEKLARMIDHTLLKPEATYSEIVNLCDEAKQYNFFAVCVNPVYVKLARENLEDSSVKIAAVVSFPLGGDETYVKSIEAERAVKSGADEIDMVMNIGLLKSKDFLGVERDICEVVNAVNPRIVKVIIETCLLSEQEKIIASTIVVSAGAQFVKTSTGFNKSGATIEDVALIRSVVGENFGVKASGGIRDYETAIKMIQAGASRIGASKSIDIVK
jgi:deoxyribose-phosphate aldolase